MRRRCVDQPGPHTLTDGPGCFTFYDDAERSTICPHDELNPWTDAMTILLAIAQAAAVLDEYGLARP